MSRMNAGRRITVLLLAVCCTLPLFAQKPDTTDDGLERITSATGIAILFPGRKEYFLYKGQHAALWNFITTDYADDNHDGIVQATSSVQATTAPELRWVSMRSGFQADMQRVPPQDSFYYFNGNPRYRSFVHIDAARLRVGETYQLDIRSCSESGTSVRVCAGVADRLFTVIPFPIALASATSPTGSFAAVNLAWERPNNPWWPIRHYAILRRDNDSIRIEDVLGAVTVRTGLSLNDVAETLTDGKRGVASFYAVAGYDSLGEVVALSNSIRASYPKESFSLTAPYDGEILRSRTPVFEWQEVPGATYELTVSEFSSFSSPQVISGLTTNRYVSSDTAFFRDHLSYYWKVRAVTANSSASSNETGWNFNINAANIAPQGFNVLAPAIGEVSELGTPSFQWSASYDRGDTILYSLLVAKEPTFASPIFMATTRENYFHTHVPFDEGRYYWKVLATDGDGLSSESFQARYFDVRRDDPPVLFELLSPRWNLGRGTSEEPVETSLQPAFLWRSSSDPESTAIRYTLWYGTDSNFAAKTEVTNLTDTTYTPSTPLLEDRQYYWKVRASDGTGTINWSSGLPFSFVTNTVNRSPAAAVLLAPAHGSFVQPETLTLRWTRPADDLFDYLFYDLWYAQDASFTSPVVVPDIFGAHYYALSGLIPGQYYWKIVTRSRTLALANGGVSESAVRSFSVLPAAPLLSAPADSAVDVVRNPLLQWNPSAGAASYHVQLSTAATFSSFVINDSGLAATSRQITIVQELTRYYWRVRARDANGRSLWSDVWEFTTRFGPLAVGGDEPAPLQFHLAQNYPNPFNPRTHFQFTIAPLGAGAARDFDPAGLNNLSRSSRSSEGEERDERDFASLSNSPWVTLKVYNILGEEVAVLVNEVKEPGEYAITWKADGMPSGIYLIRMRAGTFQATTKAILMR